MTYGFMKSMASQWWPTMLMLTYSSTITLTHPLPLSISSLLQAPFGSEQRWDFVPSSMIVCSQCPHIHLSVAQSGWSNRCEGFKWPVVSWGLCVAALWCQRTKKTRISFVELHYRGCPDKACYLTVIKLFVGPLLTLTHAQVTFPCRWSFIPRSPFIPHSQF